jgi:hypothetical protein
MRLSPRPRTITGALILTVALSGCGSSGSLLSAGAASQLSADLTQASTALDDYNCPAARAALTNFANNVAALQGVNATLVQMLGQGVDEVRSLARARCPSGQTTTATNPARTVTVSTRTHTDTSPTTTRTSPARTTTTVPVTTTDTSTSTSTNESGGAAPTTTTAPAPATTTVAPPPVTSGGAGLAGAGPGGGPGGGT